MKRPSKPLVSNFVLFLVPVAVPLLLLGSMAISVSQNQLATYIRMTNRNTLVQTDQNLSFILGTLVPVTNLLENDVGVTSVFDELFTSENLPYASVKAWSLVNGFMTSLALTHPYIQSMYVYYDNPKGYFYSSSSGRTPLASFSDSTWFSLYKDHGNATPRWTVKRAIRQPGEPGKTQTVVSIFQLLGAGEGVVVLNLTPNSLSGLWKGLTVMDDQDIVVLSEDDTPLVSLRESPRPDAARLHTLAARLKGGQTSIRDQGCLVTLVQNPTYGWSVLSITPEDSLYRLPLSLSALTIVLLIVSSVVAGLLTRWLVRANERQVQRIAELLESTTVLPDLPEAGAGPKDIYNRISYEIVRTFVEQKYLKLQLSEKSYHLKVLELENLQSQLSPHFLVNTMKTIFWKSWEQTGGPNEVASMVETLTSLLGYSLREPSGLVPLADELTAVQDYLSIMSVRYEKRSQTVLQVPTVLSDCLVPRLFLQPLLENCIYHGIREAFDEKFVVIRVRARVEGRRLILQVSDRGVGIDPVRLDQIRASLANDAPLQDGRRREHIGLMNTHRRIRLQFGSPWGLDIRSRTGYGTTVRVTFPVRR